MSKIKTILNYRGPIEFETTEILLQKVKKDLEAHAIKKVLKKRVYNIMVECIENILRHHAAPPNTTIHPYIILEQEQEGYLITAGNLISNDEVNDLHQKIDHVKGQDKEGLLKMYEDQINKDGIAINKGAGLGIITIALKANSKINYNFTPVNAGWSVFELQVSVPLEH
ncbi:MULTISPECIES: SiaB family protein kinase [unclassified Saccharicrinis]|uniref:SiaB family protein kinase n=1 Tax=unclassified Saccharicrinis TaxID=2646859 RepID=UPI003D3324B6